MVRATFAGITTALSSLQANQKRLDIVGQNLSNMNTPGYTRQQLDVTSLNHLSPVSHYANGAEINVGFGVKMDGVSRIRDPYLDVQYRDQIGKSSYNDTMQVSLDTLANFLDEHTISGIRQAFDDVQSTLNNMQDPAKVTDPIMDSELRARMQILTNTLNDAARQIDKAKQQEYEFLDGTQTSENGAVQKVNDILKQIGDLNIQIKRNQVVDQPSLELMDERDMLLDELASYIPIEVTYYKDSDREGWPYDLRVDMIYSKGGATERLTLVQGSEGGRGKNYGKIIEPIEKTGTEEVIKIDPVTGQPVLDANGQPETETVTVEDPRYTKLTFTQAESAYTKRADVEIAAGADTSKENNFANGSIQASLDMLGKTGTQVGSRTGADLGKDYVRGYQYYMDQLDTLANAFAQTINDINNSSVEYAKNKDGALLGGADAIGKFTAASIKISDDWAAGNIKVGSATDDGSGTGTAVDEASMNQTVLAMSKAFEDTTIPGLNKNIFASYMNHVSTILATDSYANQQELKTNVTVLNGIQDSRDEISGVSLDEEAANMMAYLNAYNAASRLMTTLDEALNTLINNTGLVGR